MGATTSTAVLLAGLAPLVLLADGVGLLDWLFQTDPRPSFVRDLVVGLITVVCGIPAGLAVSNRIQLCTDRERKITLLRASRRALALNVDLLGSMFDYCSPFVKSLPSFFVDTTVLAVTARDRHDLFEPHTAALIDRVYYELMHVQRRLDMLIEEKRTLSIASQLECASLEHPTIHGELAELARYRETAWIADRLRTQFTAQMPIEYAMFAGTKRALLCLAVGLTPRAPRPGSAPHTQRRRRHRPLPDRDRRRRRRAPATRRTGDVAAC